LILTWEIVGWLPFSVGGDHLSSPAMGLARAAMAAAVALKGDQSSEEFRRLAAKAKDANQARRLLALAAIRDGKGRAEAARIGGMDRQTLRDWVHAFDTKGVDGLINRKAPGRKSKLTAEQKEAVREIVEKGPDSEVDAVVRWRCVDLCGVINKRFGVDLAAVSVGRLLKELGFAHVSARPRHPKQDQEAIETFKKSSRAKWQKS
jgi:transposase